MKKLNKNVKNYQKGKKEKLAVIKESKEIIRNTFLVFYKCRIFANRLNFVHFFPEESIRYWEFYLSEIQIALNQISLHERDFLEDCYLRKMNHKDMFLSKSAFYRCLKSYSIKFLSFFDYELFHKTLADIYNSPTDPFFTLEKKDEKC